MLKRVPVLLGFMVAVAFSLSIPVRADQVSVVLTGVSGGVQGGVYTSPYYATVGGVANTQIVCDDYEHAVYMGESWTAQVSTFSDLSQVRFQQGSASATLQLYEEAGWLFMQLFNPTNSSSTGNISFAIWEIFDSAVSGTAGWTGGTNPATAPVGSAEWWLAQAQGQTWYAGEFNNLEILTPVNPTSPQEYFVMTPEPATLGLLAIGLLGLLVLARMKRFSGLVNA